MTDSSTLSQGEALQNDAVFMVRQLQKKYLAVNKRLYMTFMDLEKVFECVPNAEKAGC